MSKYKIVSYDDTRKLSPATVKAVWFVFEKMIENDEAPGREELWAVPDIRDDLLAEIKMVWAKITGRSAVYYPYADWLIQITWIRVRKMTGKDRSQRFHEATGRKWEADK